MPGFEMEFEIQCPNDGVVTVGLENIEGLSLKDQRTAELVVRCPKCGTLIKIITQLPPDMPAGFMQMVEAISQSFDTPGAEGDINSFFGKLEGMHPNQDMFGFGFMQEQTPPAAPLKQHDLDKDEEAHVEYFRSELDKLDSVDDFLRRIDEGD